ncbi:MAG: hypothetical protein ACRC8W_01180 [Plesiomonas shigelloides]
MRKAKITSVGDDSSFSLKFEGGDIDKPLMELNRFHIHCGGGEFPYVQAARAIANYINEWADKEEVRLIDCRGRVTNCDFRNAKEGE